MASSLIASFLGAPIRSPALTNTPPPLHLLYHNPTFASTLESFPSLLPEVSLKVFPKLTSGETTSTSTSMSIAASSISPRHDLSTFVPNSQLTPTSFPSLHSLLQSVKSEVATWRNLPLSAISQYTTSIQIARYLPPAPGTVNEGYFRHCDSGNCGSEQSSSLGEKNGRKFTAIVYLTTCTTGGELRVFYPSPSSPGTEQCYDVAMQAGKMVAFESDKLEHEVRPVGEERVAITVWFYPPPPLSPPSPSPTPSISSTSLPTIFVTIPCYADKELAPTIASLLSNLVRVPPSHIFFGVCLQLDTTTTTPSDYLHSLPPSLPPSNVRLITLDLQHATGPCYARSLARSLWRGEDYHLGIDCHMRFRYGWDELCLDLVEKLESSTSKNVILTTYPAGYKLDDDNNDDNVEARQQQGTTLYPTSFDQSGMLRQSARTIPFSNITNSIPTPLFAAGFNFSRSDALNLPGGDLPNFTHFVFFGEEIFSALRLYTSGWDFHAPKLMVCWHLWEREGREGGGDWRGRSEIPAPRRKAIEKKNVDRIANILKGVEGGELLGKQRTIEEFEEFVGVNFKTMKVNQEKWGRGGGGDGEAARKVMALLGLNL